MSACSVPVSRPEQHHRQRHDERHEAGEDHDDELLAEDVAEEPQRQRHHARQVADELDGQHQRRERDGRSRRHGEVLEVRDDALLADAFDVVEDPHREGAADRDVEIRTSAP